MTSPLLSRPGAAEHQEETLVDAAGVAWHYGNPLNEQRAADSHPVVVDRSHRRVIKVTGPDAPGFLNNLLTQKLDSAATTAGPSGFTGQALDLDIQGHILHAMDVTAAPADAVSAVDAGATDFYLDLPADLATSLAEFLEKMKFWSEVSISVTDLAVVTVLGETTATAVREAVPDHALVRDFPWKGRPRVDVLVDRAKLATSVSALEAAGFTLAGLMAYTAERVRVLEPEQAADLDGKSIPHEISHWIGRGDNPGAVHLDKGCYRGQETVARVENLGRSPRLLVMLHLDGSAPELPGPGAEITFNGRGVGRLGTVVHDCDYGPIALALVKRTALDRGELLIGDVAASVDPDSLPTDEGPKAGRAAVDKLRGRQA